MYKKFFKRLIDFFIALILSVILTPLILFCAILVWAEDKGSPFYCAKRIGRKGKLFPMIKLRTMKVNAPDIRLADGSTYNSENDPRVTKIGRFLRKTSLDELPQIYNILVGQMAFIGPRPDTPIYIDKYTEEEKIILTVRPGLTGYNQALNRNSVLTKEKLSNDIYYVNHLSFLFDVKIVFLTVKAVLSKSSVYRNESETVVEEQYRNKTIMILGGSVLQRPAVLTAKKLGLNVVVCDYNPSAVAFSVDGVIKEVVSTLDKNAVLEAAKRHNIDGIMTLATDRPMRTVAYVAENMKLNGISTDTSIKATDKWFMRNCLKEYGVPVPEYVMVNNINDYLKATESIQGKFIVKPTDNSGSRGVFLTEKSASDYETAFYYAKKSSNSGNVLVEEYMQGQEVSVETISVDGKCRVIQITDKLTNGAPHFVEIGHGQPSALPVDVKDEIKKVTIAANSAIGIKDGPSHTEIIVTKEGPKIVEIGARLGGDCITSHLVPLSTGVDVVRCCIDIALGNTPIIVPKFNRGAAIMYFPQRAGVFNGIVNKDKALKIKGVQDIVVVKEEGERITDADSSADRIGFVIASGVNKGKAMKACNKALKTIKVIIGDDDK